MVLRRSEDRGQPEPPPSVAVGGHRLSFVLPEALDFAFEGAIVARGQGSGWPTGESAFGAPALSSRRGRDVDSVAPPPTESPHTMPRGKQPLVFGQWTHGGRETACALGRYRIQTDGAGRGA